MRLAFDLDGTLIDTRLANLTAYRRVGVEPPPESAYLPAHMWLKDNALHDAKQEIYPECLQVYGRELPTAKLFRAMGGIIITGASARGVTAATKVFPWLTRANDILWGHSPDDKIRRLHDIVPGLYFDDDSKFVVRVREDTQWQAIDVSGW